MAYGSAIRDALSDAGFDDVPRNGAYVIGGIARTGAPLSEIVAGLGASRQAAGQLVDTLAVRGYLDRSVDGEDRRRLTITLTDRGLAAAAAVRSAVEQVDADLLGRVGTEHVSHVRATLASLIEAGRDAAGHDDGLLAKPPGLPWRTPRAVSRPASRFTGTESTPGWRRSGRTRAGATVQPSRG